MYAYIPDDPMMDCGPIPLTRTGTVRRVIGRSGFWAKSRVTFAFYLVIQFRCQSAGKVSRASLRDNLQIDGEKSFSSAIWGREKALKKGPSEAQNFGPLRLNLARALS
jgi:hypothetical protein